MHAVGEECPGPATGEIDPEAGAGEAGVSDGFGRAALAARPPLIGPFPAMGAAGAERSTHQLDARPASEQLRGIAEHRRDRTEQAGMSGPLQRRAIFVMHFARQYALAPGAI